MYWIDNYCFNKYLLSMNPATTVQQLIHHSVATTTPALTVHALRTACAHVERALAWALEPFGVTTSQFELLQVVQRHGNSGVGCSELGKHLAAPGPDVTRMLDRLDTAGLVERTRHDKDRRVVHTALTEKGEGLLANAGPAIEQAERAVFDGLADYEREQLITLLHGIRRNCRGN